mmetsp:Transcript_6748/g.12984  ORF Transcript_6748/g.12984 Transcript_6748/m.12984 type:complete len:318 (-) Transcript_6748:438-1391(-)
MRNGQACQIRRVPQQRPRVHAVVHLIVLVAHDEVPVVRRPPALVHEAAPSIRSSGDHDNAALFSDVQYANVNSGEGHTDLSSSVTAVRAVIHNAVNVVHIAGARITSDECGLSWGGLQVGHVQPPSALVAAQHVQVAALLMHEQVVAAACGIRQTTQDSNTHQSRYNDAMRMNQSTKNAAQPASSEAQPATQPLERTDTIVDMCSRILQPGAVLGRVLAHHPQVQHLHAVATRLGADVHVVSVHFHISPVAEGVSGAQKAHLARPQRVGHVHEGGAHAAPHYGDLPAGRRRPPPNIIGEARPGLLLVKSPASGQPRK